MSVRGPAPRLAVRFCLAAVLLTLTARAGADANDDAYHQALLNYKGGNYPAARLAIDDAETADPNNVAIAILKGRILTEQKDFADGETLLRRFLGPNGPLEVQLAMGDLYLRARNFSAAANMYDQALSLKPNDPDITLKLIYSKINMADLVTAGKYASELKPLDPLNPAYYFARAALAEAIGKDNEAEQDIETARTIYGITIANRYLKTYLEVSTSHPKTGVSATPKSDSASPAPKPPSP